MTLSSISARIATTAILSFGIAMSVQPAPAQQQATPAPLALQTLPPAGYTAAPPDPLAPGKEAMARKDYQAAQTFFDTYYKANPDNLEALLREGDASLALKQYERAAQDFKRVIGKDPTAWVAHKNLIIADASLGNWQEFDSERKLLEDARASDSPGLDKTNGDVVEVIYLGTERYVVRAFPVLTSRFKSRYNFAHYDKNEKLESWISCESPDEDQAAFAQKHPQEAASGQRSFSLVGYAIGPKETTRATIKNYPDGEPGYETVRTDVIAFLTQKKP